MMNLTTKERYQDVLRRGVSIDGFMQRHRLNGASGKRLAQVTAAIWIIWRARITLPGIGVTLSRGRGRRQGALIA